MSDEDFDKVHPDVARGMLENEERAREASLPVHVQPASRAVQPTPSARGPVQTRPEPRSQVQPTPRAQAAPAPRMPIVPQTQVLNTPRAAATRPGPVVKYEEPVAARRLGNGPVQTRPDAPEPRSQVQPTPRAQAAPAPIVPQAQARQEVLNTPPATRPGPVVKPHEPVAARPAAQPTQPWQNLSHDMARRAEPVPKPATAIEAPPAIEARADVVKAPAPTAPQLPAITPKRRGPKPAENTSERMFVQLRLALPVALMFRTVADAFGLDHNAAGAMLLTFGYDTLSRQQLVPPKAALS